MKKYILFILILPYFISAQVGFGTLNPKGMLEISSSDSGMVIPRVTSINDVTDGNGNPAVDGTIVYDISLDKICFKTECCWISVGKDINGNTTMEVINTPVTQVSNYIKASNTDGADQFGFSISISGDGSRMAVSAKSENSNATGINGDQSNNSTSNAGAVYVFKKSGAVWAQEAYIKSSNTDINDRFGQSVSLSADGTRLAVGASNEDSNATGINGDQSNNSAPSSGAVYIFSRSGTIWTQEAYIKASNAQSGDNFGFYVSLDDDASRIAVGAYFEDSNATGINGDQSNNSASKAGAVYVFSRTGTTWSQETYIKASNSETGDWFGRALSLSSDGLRLAVGAYKEKSNATGIGGNQSDNSLTQSGAVYIFSRSGTIWTQETYIKASNTETWDGFGYSLSLSKDASSLAIGAIGEDSNATGIGGNQSDNNADGSGAVYLFSRSGTIWTQEAYIKASNTGSGDGFGWGLSLNRNGTRLAVGAFYEASNAIGIDGDETDNSASFSGAAYLFGGNATTWTQEIYIKASNAEAWDEFGIGISLSGDGCIIAVGATAEKSNATGINGDQSNNSLSNSGAVYIIE